MTLISLFWIGIAHAYSLYLDARGEAQYIWKVYIEELLSKP